MDRISKDLVPAVRKLFVEHGWDGPLSVVDDQPDEAVFLVPNQVYLAVDQRTLVVALGSLLHRKVWITDSSSDWLKHARPFE